jgi:hypothetical protein
MASPAAIVEGLTSAFPELDEFARRLRQDAASSDIERETNRQTDAWKPSSVCWWLREKTSKH